MAPAEAVRLHPESASAHLNLGNLVSDLGLLDEAADASRKPSRSPLSRPSRERVGVRAW
jgi:hypothetical protein